MNNLIIVDDAILEMVSHQRATKKFENRCLSPRDVLKQTCEVN